MIDCMKCGACCVNHNPVSKHRVTLSEGDKNRMSEEAKKFVFNVRDFYLKKGILALGDLEGIVTKTNEQGWQVCTFLDGQIGEAVGCRIYDDRPSKCVNFERGGNKCLQMIKDANLNFEVNHDIQLFNTK